MKTRKVARIPVWRSRCARRPRASPARRNRRSCVAGYQRVLKQYQADPTAAEKLVSIGEWPRDKALDVAEHAAHDGDAEHDPESG